MTFKFDPLTTIPSIAVAMPTGANCRVKKYLGTPSFSNIQSWYSLSHISKYCPISNINQYLGYSNNRPRRFITSSPLHCGLTWTTNNHHTTVNSGHMNPGTIRNVFSGHFYYRNPDTDMDTPLNIHHAPIHPGGTPPPQLGQHHCYWTPDMMKQ